MEKNHKSTPNATLTITIQGQSIDWLLAKCKQIINQMNGLDKGTFEIDLSLESDDQSFRNKNNSFNPKCKVLQIEKDGELKPVDDPEIQSLLRLLKSR